MLAALGVLFSTAAGSMRDPLTWLVVVIGVGGYAWEALKRWKEERIDERAEQIAHLSSHITKQLALAVTCVALVFAMASGNREVCFWMLPVIATLVLPDQFLRRYLGQHADEPAEGRRERRMRRLLVLIGCAVFAAVIVYFLVMMSQVLESFQLSRLDSIRLHLGEHA
ncbi:MAG: hypothetical protein WC728_13655 [Elusimicrobiota bacterium]